MTADERLTLIRNECFKLPEVTEDNPWGHVAFRIRNKIFAIVGDESRTISLKTTFERKPILEQDPAISHAPYVGNKGWVLLDLEQDGTFDILPDLASDSYRLVASKLTKKAQKELGL